MDIKRRLKLLGRNDLDHEAVLREGANRIAELEAREPQWIDVNDRLPEKYVIVHVWPPYGDECRMESMDRCSIQDSGWLCENHSSAFSHKSVTHWQPIIPPKEQD